MTDLLDHVSWEEPSWEEDVPGPRRWPYVLLGVLAAAVLAYGGAAWWLGDRVPRGTTVSGVDIGGRDEAGARAALERELLPRTEQPLVLTSSAGEAELDPAAAGLGVDVPATVADLVGFTLDPVVLWHHVAGGGEEPAVLAVDVAAFEAALEEARGSLDAEPVEGSLGVGGGTIAYTAPVRGTDTDVAGTLAAVERWWPAQRSVEVAADEVPPTVPAAELERVRDEFATVAVSGPVTVEANGRSFELAPADFAPAVVLEPAEDGTITPRADDERLREIVHEAAAEAEAEVEPQPAVVTFRGRTPSVKAHVNGVALEDESISAAVWQAIGSEERTATVTTREVRPDFTTRVARDTLPTEVVSSFTTYYQAGQSRVDNIRRAAEVIDGTYVLPGEQFSMNGVLGERTEAKGYVSAGIIRYGRLADSVGGGISQLSTTIFNASFFAGVQLDAWQPHSFYISRYPEGREATISWPDLHNIWTNTLDGGILVEAKTTDTSVTVTYYGTKKYDVEATKSDRYDVVEPERVVDDGEECKPQSPVEGFTVDVGRIMRAGGEVVQRQTFTTRYDAADDITCTYDG
ncbi:VanW family protein [Phycicoccus sp. BSK3Z-2]|uniref:VanW family protein n=1 Tax=Phycicoccus avicenniae TaxID=2828860 RepID=A0A941HYH6_9MICO|nr:VanW family protein [Phycicoccus avicenniae]MBR7742973.1 VanW family protein [Phycicoccus avicenniae]